MPIINEKQLFRVLESTDQKIMHRVRDGHLSELSEGKPISLETISGDIFLRKSE